MGRTKKKKNQQQPATEGGSSASGLNESNSKEISNEEP